MAVSLTLHAVLLGLIGPGLSEPVAASGAAPALQVQLATETPATPARRTGPPPPGPAKRSAAPLPLPGLAPTGYLRSSELDERAAPIEIVPLLYPQRAYINRIPGTVRVRIFISAEGSVDRAEVVTASPPGHFEEAALDAVQRTRFTSARKNGNNVASQKVIEVSFDPYGPKPLE